MTAFVANPTAAPDALAVHHLDRGRWIVVHVRTGSAPLSAITLPNRRAALAAMARVRALPVDWASVRIVMLPAVTDLGDYWNRPERPAIECAPEVRRLLSDLATEIITARNGA